MVSQNVSKSTDQDALIICVVMGTVFLIMRCCARYYKIRKIPIEAEDCFMYLALVSFIIMSALYLATIPTFFNVEAIEAGKMAPYANLESHLVRMLKEFFVVQIFFWLTLWSVKWSLLFMFKRLTEGLRMYTMIWYSVLAFSILTFIGCIISNFTSCSSMHAWFTAGECTSARDSRAKAISLWYCLATDLVTDLMIMVIPVKVLWTLRISLAEKLSVGLVFVVGLLTMVFAIVRVVSLNSSVSSNGGEVSTTWLMLWAAIEGVVAILVGCLPSFAVFLRTHAKSSQNAYNSYTNGSQSKPSSHIRSRSKSAGHTDSVLLDEVEPIGRVHDFDSKPSLTTGENAITITHGWSQKWHDGNELDQERERNRKIGFR